ncbi:quinon protein alcohol dehydrogenase-like superfamily [Baffinella frigidus]|nr:quinon protein alcohol dehydrogenase-like superfamily [Cryptophyta sp. CCMP2293]
MASPGLIVLGQRDGRVHFVDAFTGARRENLRTHSQSVSCVAISRDGHFIASWSPGGTIKMREASGSIMFDVEQLARVSVMAFSPSSHLLAVGSDRTTVLLRDAKTGKLEWVLQHPFPWATASISFSAERALLATSSDEGQILIWDISEPVPSTGVKTRGMELVRCSIDTTVSGSHPVVFSPDGRTVASASVSSPQRVSTVKIWDADTGKVKKEFAGHRGSILSLCFSPDGSALASGSTDKTVRVWEVESGAQRLCLLGHYSGDGCLCNNGLLNWALHPGFLPQANPYTLCPTPYTLHPTPYTLNPTPYTLHPTP